MIRANVWGIIVMRKEAVYTLLLNAKLFKGMKCTLAQDPRYIRFSVFEGDAPTTYNLRVSGVVILRLHSHAHDRSFYLSCSYPAQRSRPNFSRRSMLIFHELVLI